jgi:hypothetical protein
MSVPGIAADLNRFMDLHRAAQQQQLPDALPCTLELTDIDGYQVFAKLRAGHCVPGDRSSDDERKLDKRRHWCIVGPTGAGKSTQLAVLTAGKAVCRFGGHAQFPFETYNGESLLVCDDSIKGKMDMNDIIGATDYSEHNLAFQGRNKMHLWKPRQHRTLVFLLNPRALTFLEANLELGEWHSRFNEVNLFDEKQSLAELFAEFRANYKSPKWTTPCAPRKGCTRPPLGFTDEEWQDAQQAEAAEAEREAEEKNEAKEREHAKRRQAEERGGSGSGEKKQRTDKD